jgi:hypothetical protein
MGGGFLLGQAICDQSACQVSNRSQRQYLQSYYQEPWPGFRLLVGILSYSDSTTVEIEQAVIYETRHAYLQNFVQMIAKKYYMYPRLWESQFSWTFPWTFPLISSHSCNFGKIII